MLNESNVESLELARGIDFEVSFSHQANDSARRHRIALYGCLGDGLKSTNGIVAFGQDGGATMS